MAPSLPARKAGSRRVASATPRSSNQLPIASAQEIELPDGTRIPIKIPEGMPAHQAQALIEYLKANPEAAKQVQEQAKQILKTPGMASAFMNMQASTQNPEMAAKYAALKDDPELKHVFEDVLANGPAAFQKYWDDDEMLTKIAAKMRSLNMGSGSGSGNEAAAGGSSGMKPKGPVTTLHDAAKFGDEEAVRKLLEEGKDVDEPNERGIAPLGIAVGFNRTAIVSLLLEKGAQVDRRDPAGNTVLHYAAGYGRKEVAALLIAAGADVEATNKAGQKPADAAKMNREMALVEYLNQAAAGMKRVDSTTSMGSEASASSHVEASA